MSLRSTYDAVVVGSGPNGLGAAITLAQAGRSVLVVEAGDVPGGAVRSAETVQPGFVHDLGSGIHPLALASPLFRTLPLERYGLEWVHPEVPLAHPLDGGEAVALHRSVDETAAQLGPDGEAYRRLFGPLAARWEALLDEFLQPVVHVPRHPVLMARFGLLAVRSGRALAERKFSGEKARALFAGSVGHAAIPLESLGSSGFGLVLTLLGHAVGWPFPKGGAQSLTNALVEYLRLLGGEVVTGWRVENVDDLPAAQALLLDVTPRQVLRIAGHRLPEAYRRRLRRYRYGTAAFKVDYALDGPVPWANPLCARAATLHLGGTLAEIAKAEARVAEGQHPAHPFVIAAQHSLFDPSRAPEGQHTLWAYCHVPNGSTVDMTDAIEAQIERFAPGFQQRIVARRTWSPADLEAWNPNIVGGDIFGGSQTIGQVLGRPVLRPRPYRTPARGLYLCSASTPPGGGVHGMAGFHAARLALNEALR